MESKEQLDQNPENVKKQLQEENSNAELQSDKKAEEQSTQPEENQDDLKTDVKLEEIKKKSKLKETENEPSEEVKQDDKKTAKSKSVKSSIKKEENTTTEISDATEVVDAKTELKESTKNKTKEQALKGEEEDHDEHEEEHHEEEILENYAEQSREELVPKLEELVKEEGIETIRKKVALIKVAFLKINKEDQHQKYESFIADGGEKSDFDSTIDDLEKRFNDAFSVYKTKRKVFLEEQEKIKQNNLELKKIILEELKALIDSEESLKKTYDEFKALQDKWKEIGMVPKSEVNNLWQSYHFLVEKFFDKVKINKELRDLDLKKNLESKIGLCEKAEELLLETSILKSFKQLQHYHQQWKEIGPVPQEQKDDIWERFKNTTDKINQLRREHYDKLQEEQQNNLTAKIALCEKAEELILIENNSIKDWQNNTNQINELLKVWKTIGQAPRKENDEIWDRFKTSLDTFFTAKKEYFQKIKDEQHNNYNLKLDLCVQAEAIKNNTEWKKTTHDLINLQKEWKNIGPVPRKHSDKIWKRFRAACDEFFNAKSDFYANIGEHEKNNLNLKEELVKKITDTKFEADKNANLELLKGFQREWTEIGHVPVRDKDRIHNEFRKAINDQLDKLKINKAEMQTINFKQRFEGIKENPDARRILSNERNFLIGKRKKLEEEINLWENNLGFLASSKKADLLIQEFQKKIDKAKADIEVLNEKIKFLRNES